MQNNDFLLAILTILVCGAALIFYVSSYSICSFKVWKWR